MNNKRVIVYPDADPEENEVLAQTGGDHLAAYGTLIIHHGAPESHEEYVSRIKDANALIVGWSLPAEVMAKAPHLELVTFTGTGVSDYIDLAKATAQGVTVCNCPGYANTTVAEHTFALLLGVARNLTLLDGRTREGVWDQDTPGTDLRGKTARPYRLWRNCKESAGNGTRVRDAGKSLDALAGKTSESL